MSIYEPDHRVGEWVIFWWPAAPNEANAGELMTVAGEITWIAHNFSQTLYDDEGRPYPETLTPGPPDWLYYVRVDPHQTVATYPDGDPLRSEVVSQEQIIEGEEIAF